MAKFFTLFSHILFFAVLSVSCGYNELESDAVTAIHVKPFDNAGELPKPLGPDCNCHRQSLLLWVSFDIADFADVAMLSSPMVDLKISSITDFTDDLPAGSDVTSLFMLHPIRPEISNSDFNSYDYKPVRFSIPSPQHPLSSIYREGAYFMLVAPPALPQLCQFKVTVAFADGSSLSASTDVINLY